MALKLTTELPNGIMAEEAYYKIERVIAQKDKCAISVEVYFNQNTRNANLSTVFSEFYEFSDTDSINKYVKGINAPETDIIGRGYYYLKEKISKFTNAEDI